MGNPYPDHVRESARDLFLRGAKTDAEIAESVGVQRVDTIRDWRRVGDWDAMRDAVKAAAAAESAADASRRQVALDLRHDQLAEGIEGMIVRALRDGAQAGGGRLKPADLRALAAALVSTQSVRRTAYGSDDPDRRPPPPTPPQERVRFEFVLAKRPDAQPMGGSESVAGAAAATA